MSGVQHDPLAGPLVWAWVCRVFGSRVVKTFLPLATRELIARVREVAAGSQAKFHEFSTADRHRIDLVFFVNGLPVATVCQSLKAWRRCYATSALSWAVDPLRACAI